MRSIVKIIPAILFVIIAGVACRAGAEAGEVSVVRNGGPFDNKGIKEVLCPGGQRKYIGLNSSVHPYPASGVQRYFKITSDPNEGADYEAVITAKSADGFNIHISGTMQFQTEFGCDGEGRRLVEDFDKQFGVRKFPNPRTNEHKAPWEGTDGWDAFLNAQFLPVVQNELRIAMLKFTCDQIVASCALVASRDTTVVDKGEARQTGVNLQKIQEEIEVGFAEELKAAFGEEYFGSFKFLMSQPTLDSSIETKINDSLGAFAIVSQAKAQVEQARQQARAYNQVVNLYRRSPQLAELEKWRIICGVSGGTTQNAQEGNAGSGCKNMTIIAGVGSPLIQTGRR